MLSCDAVHTECRVSIVNGAEHLPVECTEVFLSPYFPLALDPCGQQLFSMFSDASPPVRSSIDCCEYCWVSRVCSETPR